MPTHPSELSVERRPFSCGDAPGRTHWGALLITVLVLAWFYGFELQYGASRGQSAPGWICSLFFPAFSLVILQFSHSLVDAELPWCGANRRLLRRVTATRPDDGRKPKSFLPDL